jgi:prepilin-type N-terminal cleavage/methylation domain-containing protein
MKNPSRRFASWAALSRTGSRSGSSTVLIAPGQRGFTLVELLVVLALSMFLILITMPTLGTMMNRGKLTSAAQEIGSVLRLARLEAIKRGVTTVVQVDFATNSLMAYADANDAAGNSGSDLKYDPLATPPNTVSDYVIITYTLPNTVHWWGAPDDSPGLGSAVIGFTANPTSGKPNLAVFNPDGSVQATGQFRIGQGAFPRNVTAATDTVDNFLAVNVQPQATARVFVTKYNPTLTAAIGGATRYVAQGIDPTTGKALWQWY